MSLLETIQKDSFAAAKAGKSVESDILKIALSSLKNAQISKGASDELSEEEEVKIVLTGKKSSLRLLSGIFPSRPMNLRSGALSPPSLRKRGQRELQAWVWLWVTR